MSDIVALDGAGAMSTIPSSVADRSPIEGRPARRASWRGLLADAAGRFLISPPKKFFERSEKRCKPCVLVQSPTRATRVFLSKKKLFGCADGSSRNVVRAR